MDDSNLKCGLVNLARSLTRKRENARVHSTDISSVNIFVIRCRRNFWQKKEIPHFVRLIETGGTRSFTGNQTDPEERIRRC